MNTLLTSNGQVIKLDDSDYERYKDYVWHISGWGYIMRVDQLRGSVYLHKEIIGEEGYDQVDHKDGDKLNNQRSNLRPVSKSQNQQNHKVRADNTSGYKGVSFSKGRGKWEAYITCSGRRIRLGRHATPELAALAYDEAATRIFGSEAFTNFPNL